MATTSPAPGEQEEQRSERTTKRSERARANHEAAAGISASATTHEPPRMYYVATVLGEQDWLAGHDLLVSAGTAWKNPGSHGAGEGFDINIPEPERLFVDSGGFQATVHFGGEFPYTDRELFTWAADIGADYVAGMDFACETAEVLASAYDDLEADSVPSIEERIERTIEKQIKQHALYTEVQQAATARDHEDGWGFEFVPVVQGYTVEQYRYCAQRLKEAGVARDYMAIGSVCKRDDPDKIRAVLEACREVLPATEFHLFGATRRVWKDRRFWGAFRSSDTHAWAVSHPREGWPSNKTEKREAFEHFRADIRQTQQAVASQATLDSAGVDTGTDQAVALQYPDACPACGADRSTYGVGFQPQCRACQRAKLNHHLQAIHAADVAAKEAADAEIGSEADQVGISEFC